MTNAKIVAGLTAILVLGTFSFAADDTITLPAGSELHVQLITTLSTKDNDTGDFWTGKVVMPIFGKGGEIVPEGSTVDGHITFVKAPGQTKGKGEMRLFADSITTPDRSKYNLVTSLENPQYPKSTDDEGTGALGSITRKFHKKSKDSAPSQGTEMTFAISRDTAAKKVPKRQ